MADLDHVAVVEMDVMNALAVDQCAVAAGHVGDGEGIAIGADANVFAGDGSVVEGQVGLLRVLDDD